MNTATLPTTAGQPLRVAVLSRYARLGASSRMRFLQFAPPLARHNITLDVFPLFDDNYLRTLYGQGRRERLQVLYAYAQRVRALTRTQGHDLIWIEKELFPYWPYAIERLFWPSFQPTVVDYDDAVFHNYDLSPDRVVRRLLGRKIDRLMAAADLVVCGNSYLARRAKAAGARNCEIVPTVVDLARYAQRATRTEGPLVIGWIGSPATQRYVVELAGVLRQICVDGQARVVLVGAHAEVAHLMPGVPVEVLPWLEATEPTQIAKFDIGIMPLPDEPWERGKCGYKLIQYMACGTPVIASPVGANCEIVDHGANGLHASTPDQWRRAFEQLMHDPALRNAMGRAGRQRVEQHFSLQVQGERLAALLHSVKEGS